MALVSRTVASVLAHQGGWDEILLVIAPVAVIAALLAVAKRRVDRANRVPAPDDDRAGTAD